MPKPDSAATMEITVNGDRQTMEALELEIRLLARRHGVEVLAGADRLIVDGVLGAVAADLFEEVVDGSHDVTDAVSGLLERLVEQGRHEDEIVEHRSGEPVGAGA